MNDTISINETQLNRLSTEINGYSQRINNIFNQITDLVYESRSAFNCDIGDDLYRKINSLKTSMNVTTKNLKQYAEDLVLVKVKFNKASGDIVDTVRKATTNIQTYSVDGR